MKDLVEKLAREAGMTRDSGDLVGYRVWTGEPSDLERFAQLVAQECAKVCEQQQVGIDAFGGIEWHVDVTRDQCGAAIREHFGIEGE